MQSTSSAVSSTVATAASSTLHKNHSKKTTAVRTSNDKSLTNRMKSKEDAAATSHTSRKTNVSAVDNTDDLSPTSKEIQIRPNKETQQQQHQEKVKDNNNQKEQGRILSLFENYGFIYCAQRPCDLFFHFSEYKENNYGKEITLQVGDEVEFYVGFSKAKKSKRPQDSDEKKLVATSVSKLKFNQRILWEIEQAPIGIRRQGIVRRSIRARTSNPNGEIWNDRNGIEKEKDTPLHEGLLVLLPLHSNQEVESGPISQSPSHDLQEQQQQSYLDNNNETLSIQSDSILVRYTQQDYQNHHSEHGTCNKVSSSSQLLPKDKVEFTLVMETRTKQYYARNITMVLSYKDNLQQERERIALQTATLETGIVVSLHDSYGFLQSCRRKELIYFHYSKIVLPEENEALTTDKEPQGQTDCILREGQEMEFLVIPNSSRKGKNDKSSFTSSRLSARQVKFLPAGSVRFEHIVAYGVAGIIEYCPSCSTSVTENSNSESHRRRNYSSYSTDIASMSSDEIAGKVRLENPILFTPPDDGNLAVNTIVTIKDVLFYSHDAPGGLLREGSRSYLWVREGDRILFDVIFNIITSTFRAAPTQCRNVAQDEKNDNESRVVLLSPSLAGRAEGSVISIKENFGFIQLAERNAHVYFKLSDVLPTQLQHDMDYYDGREPLDSTQIEVGSEVSFNLSLQSNHGPKNASKAGSNKGNAYFKEFLRAQRLKVLPPGSIVMEKEIALEARGTVSREPSKQIPGEIKLEECLKGMTLEERYPLITKLLDNMNQSETKEIISFCDLQSLTDTQNIRDMISLRKGFTISFIPITATENRNHPGRISIQYDPAYKSSNADIKLNTYSEVPEVRTTMDLEKSVTTGPVVTNVSAGETEGLLDDLNMETAMDKLKHREASSKLKISKTQNEIFQSVSFTAISCENGRPPKVGDIVTCAIFQSRYTNQFIARDITIVAPSTQEVGPDSQDKSVKERTRLNLSVRMELDHLGAKINAQSGMAKGPEGNIGFPTGWTLRRSIFVGVPSAND